MYCLITSYRNILIQIHCPFLPQQPLYTITTPFVVQLFFKLCALTYASMCMSVDSSTGM